MARIVQSKYPIDLEPRKALAFGFPLNADAVFRPIYTTKEQIKANLINFLLTNKKERVFRPNFGGDLRSLLFSNVNDSTLEDLEENIKQSISSKFPAVTIKDINFDNQLDNNRINFTLTYDIVTFGISDQVTIQFQR